jgi:uncharacterized protein (TIGR02145 family)
MNTKLGLLVLILAATIVVGVCILTSGCRNKCCHEEDLPSVPVVATDTVSVITQITAQCGGTILSDGGAPVTARGVCWSHAPDPVITDDHTSDSSGTGPFTSYITGLVPDTLYYVRAYATNSVGTAYGNEYSFTTFAYGASCPGLETFNYGGQVYHTVQIGSQCWMKENLNIGNRIDGIKQQADNGDIEKYCYGNQETNCDEYGGLYQWGEVVQYLNGASNTTTWNPVPTGNVQGICPPGWHIPTEAEFTEVIIYMGGDQVAGGKLKEAGYAHWTLPNLGADNLSGFTGLPGGVRNFEGSLQLLGRDGLWWTASEITNLSSYHFILQHFEVGATSQVGGSKVIGRSVRCVRD